MYSYNDIKKFISTDVKAEGEINAIHFDNVLPILEANENSLVWIKESVQEPLDKITSTSARLIVCSNTLKIPDDLLKKKFFLKSSNPKLTFIRLAEAFFGRKSKIGIDPSSKIDPKAVIGKDVFIGPNVVLEACTVGDNCQILGNNFIFEKTLIGNRVIIGPGTVIGGDGFGYSRNEQKQFEKFPHFGGVIIMDDVEIGSNASIDRGTLGNTIIKDGVKIDNLVHIAHNVIIGEHSLIIANAMIGGSTTIGAYSWIAPSADLMNGIQIGKDVTVGMGAVVTKNIPDGETWTGIPARPIKEFVELQNKLRKL